MKLISGKRFIEKIPEIHTPNDIIIQHSGCKMYTRFERYMEFEKWYINLPRIRRVFYEVILMDDSQKLKLDLDGPANIKDAISDIKYFFQKNSLDLPNIIVYNICGLSKGSKKSSYHIIVSSHFFENADSVEIFIRKLCKSSQKTWTDYVDRSVYKKTQSFRLEGSTKDGEYRWKYKMNEQCIDTSMLPGIVKVYDRSHMIELKINIPISPKVAYRERQISIPDGFKIRFKQGSLVTLDRIYPSYCTLCHRIHNQENGYMYNNTYMCFRFFYEKGYK